MSPLITPCLMGCCKIHGWELSIEPAGSCKPNFCSSAYRSLCACARSSWCLAKYPGHHVEEEEWKATVTNDNAFRKCGLFFKVTQYFSFFIDLKKEATPPKHVVVVTVMFLRVFPPFLSFTVSRIHTMALAGPCACALPLVRQDPPIWIAAVSRLHWELSPVDLLFCYVWEWKSWLPRTGYTYDSSISVS